MMIRLRAAFGISSAVFSLFCSDLFAQGCPGLGSLNLSLLAAPQPVISAAPYVCNGQITLNAGGGYSAYSWSGGQSVSTITVTTDGIYSVTIPGANACTGVSTFFADIPDVPVVSISGAGQICQGNSTVLQATTGFGAYVWSNGQTLQDITVSTAGNYEVTATDGFGCTAVDVFPVQVLPNPAPQISGPGSICAGGFATFSVPGSFNAYSWSNGETTASYHSRRCRQLFRHRYRR